MNLEYCPKCKHRYHDANKSPYSVMYRHWKEPKDYFCGWCGAVFLLINNERIYLDNGYKVLQKGSE